MLNLVVCAFVLFLLLLSLYLYSTGIMQRKCFPPGKWAENNYFMDEKMYKLQDCPGGFLYYLPRWISLQVCELIPTSSMWLTLFNNFAKIS